MQSPTSGLETHDNAMHRTATQSCTRMPRYAKINKLSKKAFHSSWSALRFLCSLRVDLIPLSPLGFKHTHHATAVSFQAFLSQALHALRFCTWLRAIRTTCQQL